MKEYFKQQIESRKVGHEHMYLFFFTRKNDLLKVEKICHDVGAELPLLPKHLKFAFYDKGIPLFDEISI